MSRIRTIKPEFWGHPRTAKVPREARLLFLGLLNEADDEGRMRYSPKRLAGVLFPFDDDVDSYLLSTWVETLIDAGLVDVYDVNEALYLQVCGFLEHQRISHPAQSRFPAPPSAVPPRSLRSPSAVPPQSLGKMCIGNREQGTGNREQGKSLVPSEPSSVTVVFDHWKTGADRNGKTVLNPKRKRLIERALNDYPLDDVLAAVVGWRKSPFHSGQNDGRKVYNDLELLLRDAQHIEAFRDLEQGTAPTGGGFDPAVDAIRRLRALEGR